MSNSSVQPARLLRVRGNHRNATEVIAYAGLQQRLPPRTQILPPSAKLDDPIQIDTTLHVAGSSHGAQAPKPDTAYAGLTPAQRRAFLEWTREPAEEAPLAFQLLYIAHLEVDLLDEAHLAQAAHQELLDLSLHACWSSNPALVRALLLSIWLQQSGKVLADWMVKSPAPGESLELALGMQALLGEALQWTQIRTMLATWIRSTPVIDDDTLRLRLSSLAASLNEEPLQHVLHQLESAATQPTLWRCQHRQLRFLIPQPAVRRPLERLLTDILSVTEPNTQTSPYRRTSTTKLAMKEMPAGGESQGQAEDEWQLILEFGQSRSDYFELVLRECHRLPRFIQIMDEDRNMVYRITFGRRDMRRFWRIWDYVQNWSTTRAYLNGKELEKWKIWPYSQYLR